MRRSLIALGLLLGCADTGEVDAGLSQLDTAVFDALPPDGPPLPPPLDVARGLPRDAGPDGPPPDAFVPPDAGLDAAPDGPLPDMAEPDAFVPPDMAPDGPLPDMAPDGPPPCVPREELCDGEDNDCDDAVDEGRSCAAYVQDQCRIYVGQADNDRHPRGPSPTWGDCPGRDRDTSDDVRCTGTRTGGEGFALLRLAGDLNGDDHLAVALVCADARRPLVAAYIQAHCALFLGHADHDRGPDRAAAWGACPNVVNSNQGELRCTSSGFDGRFRSLALTGDVDDNDDLGWAWVCRDEVQPERAAGLQEGVALYIGWADNNDGPVDQSPTWGPCPQQVAGVRGAQRCTSTAGDGRFHRLDLGGDVDDNDELGFLLRARP